MCGPLVLALPIRKYSARLQLLYTFLYHASRIFTYSILGFVLGTIGNKIWTLGFFNVLSIALGFILLSWTVLSFSNFLPKSAQLISTFLSRKISQIMSFKKGAVTFLALGSLNGLLPCGLVYLALSSTFLYHTVSDVIFLMLGFGLATIPLLVSLNLLRNLIPNYLKTRWNYIQKILMIMVSILLILRGLEVEIPFLNPKSKPEMILCH